MLEEETFRAPHLFGVRFRSETAMEKARALLQKNRVSVSVRGNSVRVSPNVYNNEKDIEILLRCFE